MQIDTSKSSECLEGKTANELIVFWDNLVCRLGVSINTKITMSKVKLLNLSFHVHNALLVFILINRKAIRKKEGGPPISLGGSKERAGFIGSLGERTAGEKSTWQQCQRKRRVPTKSLVLEG